MSTSDHQSTARSSDGSADPTTVSLSGYVIDRLYGPDRVETTSPGNSGETHTRIGEPGEYPYTRGIHPGMYRTRGWTMRQFAGFGSADDTNARFKYLLDNAKGTNTGLSTAFDLPTLMGRDSDDNLSLGEVGRCGCRHHRRHAPSLCRYSGR